MCNNVAANILKGDERESRVKDQIDDWIENRPTLKKNVYAKELRKIENGDIIYSKGHPLKLHDKTRVYEIHIENRDRIFETVCIVYAFSDGSKKEVRRIKRYAKDTVEDIERFLENSFSIYQLYNIDLNRL